jgi:hypothetical protein
MLLREATLDPVKSRATFFELANVGFPCPLKPQYVIPYLVGITLLGHYPGVICCGTTMLQKKMISKNLNGGIDKMHTLITN